jgi:hypothetical protein
MIKWKNYYFIIFLIFLLFSGVIFANNKKKKNVILKEKIESKVDFFGRRTFEGKIVNNLDERVDFVYIEFNIMNGRNEVIEKVRSYIYGSVYKFRDGSISTSSLKSGETGTFKYITSVMADSIKKYDYNIGWKFFEELPEKY